MKSISVAAALAAALILSPQATAHSQATRLHRGSQGPAVAKLQHYLSMNRQTDYYICACGFDGAFGPATAKGLRRWQTANGYQPTGWIVIGSSQWTKLRLTAVVYRLPRYIDSQAIAAARLTDWAIDASKHPAIVTILHYTRAKGVRITLSIRAAYGGWIGGVHYNTTDGVWHIYADYGPNFVSHTYGDAPMPWAACFNGGQCLHYDGLFPSHGCIHIPSWNAAIYINRLPIGTTVVVHE